MAEGRVLFFTRPIHTFLRNIAIKVWFMAEQFSFICVTYEHSLRMFCIQSMIYGRGEGFVLDTRPINTFLRNLGIKVLFMAEEFSFICVTYEYSLGMFYIQSSIYGRVEGFVLDTRLINIFFRNIEIKV